MDWEQESAGGDLYKWETVGQKVTGVLVNKRMVKTKIGEMFLYDINTRDGEVAVPATKSLRETMRKYPADGSFIIEIEFTEEKKGNFPNPFKVFTVRSAKVTEERMKALGIDMLAGGESEGEEW
jgi:uncharacterized protein involved in exopolysaccharide biosynthesis